MQVKILNVDVENVVKGKSRYSVATVAYIFNGEARTQKIMSFANPDVFKKVPDLVGQEVEVTVTKNDGGYNQWSAIGDVGASAPVAAPSSGSTAPPATRVTGSNYETPAERAAKQVYIVKQSSINAAIALAGHNKEKTTPEDVVKNAQFFVDYVFGKDLSMESLQSDTL
jgi:hypothetical protein